MRPRYLEIEGLQSFKELQRIDFDKLSETGLFGIFGPTGSGKSTILDAITLALYGSVHRAAKGTQGIINTDMTGIRVVYAFELAKEGKRKAYRVERQYKRKKDSDNSAEGKIARLFEIDGEQEYILADKHSDVNSCVVQLLGLKFEDFTRSVVLPQNKFQEFLLAPRGEKTKMLERIFYLEEYGRSLVDKVNRQMSAVKNKLSNLEGALSTLGDASPESLIELERKMTEAQEQRQSKVNRQKEMEESYTKGMELYKLSKEYALVEQQLADNEGRKPDIDKKIELCGKAEAANSIKPIMTAYKDARSGCEETGAKLQHVEAQLTALEAEKNTAQQQYDRALQTKDKRLPELIEYNTLLQQCNTLQQEAERLDKQLAAARKEYSEISGKMEAAKKSASAKAQERELLGVELQKLDKELEAQTVSTEYRRQIALGLELEKELLALQVSLEKQQAKCMEIHNNIASIREEYNKAFKALAEGNSSLEKIKLQVTELENHKPLDREQLTKQQNNIVHMESLIQSIGSSHQSKATLENRIQALDKQQQSLHEELGKLQEDLKQAVADKNAKAEQLQKIQLQQKQHTAALLAANLQHGESCPVCGSTEHPQLAVMTAGASEQEQALEKLQHEIDELEKYIRQKENEQIKLRQQQSSLDEIRAHSLEDYNRIQVEYERHISLLPEEARDKDLEGIQAYVKAQKLATEELQKGSQLWEQSLQSLLEQKQQLEAVLTESKIQVSRQEAALDSTSKALATEQKQLQELELQHKNCAEQYGQMTAGMKVVSFGAASKDIAEKDDLVQSLTTLQKQKRAQSDALVIEQQAILEEISRINDILATKVSEGKSLKEQKDEKDRKIREIIGDKLLSAELEHTKQEIQSIEGTYKNSLDRLNKAVQVLEELQKTRISLQSSLKHFQEALQIEGSKLAEALKSKGFADEAACLEAMLEEQRIRDYQEEIKRHQRERDTLEDRRKNLMTQLGGILMTEEQWSKLGEDYELAKAELEQSISQLEAARNNYATVKNNIEQWIRLQEELKQVSRKKDMLEQIQKLLKGNAFVEFISEERMRYIAREATETLGELTKFRYSIELDAENGFVIRDNANGGVLRSVASLSGGETFLTSLSLALALSSQLQLKGQSPLEFFFLDEGFGTLDNNLLDTVLDSLERLSSRQRVIGLISHVPEMKNRISRRLIVTPPDRAGSGSQISIEKA